MYFCPLELNVPKGLGLFSASVQAHDRNKQHGPKYSLPAINLLSTLLVPVTLD